MIMNKHPTPFSVNKILWYLKIYGLVARIDLKAIDKVDNQGIV